MEIQVHLTDASIDTLPIRPNRVERGIAGARVEFRGVVRDEEEGRKIRALRYEAYSPMAEKLMRKIIIDLSARHPCQAVTVIHRHGTIPAGETAVYIEAWATHRQEALAMITQFLDRLKLDVPIWKAGVIPV